MIGQHYANKSEIQKSPKYPIGGGGGQAYFGKSFFAFFGGGGDSGGVEFSSSFDRAEQNPIWPGHSSKVRTSVVFYMTMCLLQHRCLQLKAVT